MIFAYFCFQKFTSTGYFQFYVFFFCLRKPRNETRVALKFYVANALLSLLSFGRLGSTYSVFETLKSKQYDFQKQQRKLLGSIKNVQDYLHKLISNSSKFSAFLSIRINFLSRILRPQFINLDGNFEHKSESEMSSAFENAYNSLISVNTHRSVARDFLWGG